MSASLGPWDWVWDAPLAAALAAVAVLYHLHPRVRPQRRHRVCFWAGMSCVVVAAFSPLEVGAAYLLWLHMLQHMLLMLVAAPLLAAAVPPALVGWLSRRPWVGPVVEALWNPWTATALYNAVVVLWHVPGAYAWVLRSQAAHALQHATFLLSAVLFWSVLLSPARYPSPGQRLVAVGVTAVVQFLPAFTLSVSDRVLYTPYLEVPRLWGWSALDDQRWAGVLMWVGTNLAYAVAALWVARPLLRPEPPLQGVEDPRV